MFTFKQFSNVFDINLISKRCSEVTVKTISHVHRTYLFGISNFLHTVCNVFTHKQIVITVHTQAIWITQITVINVTEKLSVCVKDVDTMVVPI